MNKATQPTKEINYRGCTERYEIVDGYLEMFVGYVHTCAPRTPSGELADRVATLNKQVAFSKRFIADKSNLTEHRIAERKALKSRLLYLAMLGFPDEGLETTYP